MLTFTDKAREMVLEFMDPERRRYARPEATSERRKPARAVVPS